MKTATKEFQNKEDTVFGTARIYMELLSSRETSGWNTSLSLFVDTYRILHPQYFARYNFNLKLTYFAKASFSLLLILLD